MQSQALQFGRWKLHPVRFAAAATLLVGGLVAFAAAARSPFSFRWDNLLESAFLLGCVLFFLGAWVAPQVIEEVDVGFAKSREPAHNKH